ncbi:hypothetical protein XELAEV_18005525mg [Xenopus laevis]|uniref:Uncharacterized protein n=1 Tax=Xenopus laevis TaxID=8355 RepID=A0A974DX10_XENLA|nr:hypothetical protein XELAEV_18005525mg [Xenopus laevis]
MDRSQKAPASRGLTRKRTIKEQKEQAPKRIRRTKANVEEVQKGKKREREPAKAHQQKGTDDDGGKAAKRKKRMTTREEKSLPSARAESEKDKKKKREAAEEGGSQVKMPCAPCKRPNPKNLRNYQFHMELGEGKFGKVSDWLPHY